jgi:hypothetical protein
MSAMELQERHFRINVHRHKTTDLLMAVSPDHKGLNVCGRSYDEIDRLIPQAIRALLEAEGIHVVAVGAAKEQEFSGFDSPTLIASAQLEAA